MWDVDGSKPKEFIDNLKKSNIYGGRPLHYNPNSVFAKGETREVGVCEGLMTMEIIYGGHDNNVKNKNEKSLVMRLSANAKQNSKSMLFMGDIEGTSVVQELLDRESKIKAKGQDSKLRSDVWVYPHHGAAPEDGPKDAPTKRKYEELAKAIQAKEIIISSDIKVSYGHPRCETIHIAARKTIPNTVFHRATGLSNTQNYENLIQCWSASVESSSVYEPYFCDTNSLGVIIRQTTKQDKNGNVIWKDIITDIVSPGNKKKKTNRGY